MQLKSIKYIENQGQEGQWELEELTLGLKNLIVGRNSTGKSRTLNVIGGLARNISVPGTMPSSANYRVHFVSDDAKDYFYELVVDNSLISHERLTIDGVMYLERIYGGSGSIWAEKIGENGMMMQFQAPPNEIAISKRRDAIQHSFIEPLFQWASLMRHYNFGSSLGKDHLMLLVKNGPAVDDKDQNQVVGLFRQGVKEFGRPFVESIIRDMSEVGYPLDDISTGLPNSVTFEGAPGELCAIRVHEVGLLTPTDQISMSQGMYRVLALLVHLNWLEWKSVRTCILVDDIGEGLDFERSCKIIDVLRKKSDSAGLQVIMSTNDRFVMNEVPLKEWTVLHREGSLVTVKNYQNSAEKFDQFRFTGLSNFSFFEMDYLEASQEEGNA